MRERAGWQSPSGNLWKGQAKHAKQEKQNSEAGLDLVTEKLRRGWSRVDTEEEYRQWDE